MNMPNKPWELHFRKNPSWKASVKLTFKRTLFYLPSSLLSFIEDGLGAVIIGAATMAVGLVCWAGINIAQVCAGLCGYLSDPIKESK